MNVALIGAGGVGRRMGSDIPKQFIEVNGKPIIVYTLELFERNSFIDYCVVVCIEEWIATVEQYVKNFNLHKVRLIVKGGAVRYDSIYNGIMSLPDMKSEDVVLVHDAVRPIVEDRIITDVVLTCQEYGASMSVTPCTDTMYLTEQGKYTDENIARERLVCGQTPEAVQYGRMLEVYAKGEAMGIRNDSITAMQVALGWKVYFVDGSKKNIKVTTPDDIELFKALLEKERRI